jgi:proline dehydrogenase
MGTFVHRITGAAKAPIHALARCAARSYIAGTCLKEAMELSERLAAHGMRSTLGYWDPVGSDPAKVFAAYHEALLALAASRRDSYLSIKFPSLGYSTEMLSSLVREAKRVNVRLHFDALGPESVDRTWAAVEMAQRQGADVGCTLPARWRRSPDDAEWAIRRGLSVRVVKGQWPDPNDARLDPRRGFEAVVERLAGKAKMVAVATHDLHTARAVIDRLTTLGTPTSLELLYGLPLKRQVHLAREFGVAARIYLPYGEAYLPYCLSQLKRNPRMAWWLLRDAMTARLGRAAAAL